MTTREPSDGAALVPDASQRWENRDRGRYYETRLVHDLFGHMQLMRAWGGIGSAQGALRWEPVASAEMAQRVLARIGTRRRQRGYALVARP